MTSERKDASIVPADSLSEPVAVRARLPKAYGAPSRAGSLRPWAEVYARLAEARVYWIATATPDGRPRARPVDGVWVRGVLYIGGSPDAGWARDLRANPKVAVHLEDGGDVVVVDGEATFLDDGAGDELAEQLAAASNAKYPEYKATADNYRGPGTIAVRPRLAYSWRNFPKDVTKYRFAGP